MSDQNNININELLLIRYMRGELSGEEFTVVDKWINESAENRKIAEDCFYLSWAVSSLNTMKKVSTRKALEKVNKRIKKQRWVPVYRKLQQVAAILLLPLLILSGYLLFNPAQKVPVHYIEARMTPGMIGSTILPDGTKVWMNSSTYLKYPSSFEGEAREVVLDGEAFFKVAKEEKKFIVQTHQSSVEVLGTEFNIDAYSHNNFIATTLVEGSVLFTYENSAKDMQSIYMKPNDQVLYDKNNHTADQRETYIPKDIAWMKGQIVLRDTPLSDVLWILSKRFNVEFIIKNPAFYKQSFTGVFTNQQIERVLEHFKRSSEIRYKIDHQLDEDGEVIKTKVELY